ncbi:DUF402 domain-containing protein [Halorarius litoreus]|uniref:DUF402 domain-containing protein n=1 Tax=Halorarius litoreus TaxID=2962676 RepID=UPI0020CF4ED4|nr:DUF402 domain-containing protein [Halorarius litoreus]
MNVRVRGIYTTAVTELFHNGDEDHAVVQASPPIRERFDTEFSVAPADVRAETTFDRQGLTLVGTPEHVETARTRLQALSRDTLAWADPAPAGAVFQGVVTDTLGSGAVVDLGDAEGFLPYDNSEQYLEGDETLVVQVRTPEPPWGSNRPTLDTALDVETDLVRLVRGGTSERTGAANLEDLLPVDPPEGWAVRWGRDEDEASMDALADALRAATDAAEDIDTGLAAADPDDAPGELVAPFGTTHVWFGREGRFALDEYRGRVTPTMPGHHRIKAATNAASAAVDFAEAICGPRAASAADGERGAERPASGAFPFDVVTRQFGPVEGDTVAIGHGKPDGRLITLGRGEVTNREPEGSITLEREMHPGGTYDALGVERAAGDVAITKFVEGRWWYATVYRGEDGTRRGTYVNVCTPVEVFPDQVRYVDLHVDVVKGPDGEVRRVDDDELDAAVDAGYLSEPLAEKAREVASKVERAL